MATRTQKAAKKQKAAEAVAVPGDAVRAKPKATKAGKTPAKPAAKPSSGPVKAKAAAKAPKAAKPKAAAAASAPPQDALAPLPEPKRTTLAERFWHRLGQRAQKKEAQAHRHEAEVEAAEAAAEAQRIRREADERKAHAAEERRKEAAAAREMKRIAEEEDARLKREAIEAAATKKAAAQEARRAKAAAAREAKAAERAEREADAARKAIRAGKPVKGKKPVLIEFQDLEVPGVAATEPEPAEAKPSPEAEAEAPPAPLAKVRPPPQADVVETPEGEEPEVVEIDEPVKHVPPAKPVPSVQAPSPPATPLEQQADKVAAELRARRSKPITIEAEDDVAPTLPVGRKARPAEEPKEVLQLDPAPPARLETPAPKGLSIPEHFLLLAMDAGWDERTERNKPGALGGALVGALLLELVLHGKVKVQRDRFHVTDAIVDDASVAVAGKLKQIGDRPSLEAMGELANWLPQLLPAYKDRMAARGLLEHKAWRHMGVFYRSQTVLLDPDAQERLRNKLARAIAGGGRPDAPTILSLGLLEASGLFGLVVPEGAQAYNRKRLNGLVAGKDVMGYKVDDELKATQEIAVRTVLDNVRLMTVRG